MVTWFFRLQVKREMTAIEHKNSGQDCQVFIKVEVKQEDSFFNELSWFAPSFLP